MKTQQQKEVDARDVQTLVEVMEKSMQNEFVFTTYPQMVSLELFVEIRKPEEFAIWMIENGSPTYDNLQELQDKHVLHIAKGDVDWDYTEADAEDICEAIDIIFNEDDTIDFEETRKEFLVN